eukprot:SM006458S20123  [mRNA]  locus=s6458:18:615:- [translate_table: standard]
MGAPLAAASPTNVLTSGTCAEAGPGLAAPRLPISGCRRVRPARPRSPTGGPCRARISCSAAAPPAAIWTAAEQARRREEGSGIGGPGAQQQQRELLACPVCYRALDRTGPAGLTQLSIQRSGFWCPRCRRAYSSRGGYLDLTVTSGATSYQAPRLPGTELFRCPTP